jgi:hypothetical protein
MKVKNNAVISRVINQGGFGCIFHPSLPCKKETKRTRDMSGSSEYVSKLVKRNFSSENEIRIGKIVQSIPFYSLYYVPVIQSCSASLAKVNDGEIKKCNKREFAIGNDGNKRGRRKNKDRKDERI